MSEPVEVSNFLELGRSQSIRDKKKESVKALRELVEYGEIKIQARRYKIDLDRAYKILQGKIQIKDHDRDFILALYDKCLRRKQMNDKLASLLN